MPRKRKRSSKRVRRQKSRKRPGRRPEILLRPGDETALRAALKRLPARDLAKTLGLPVREVKRLAREIPPPRQTAREFRELLRQADRVRAIQDIRRRAQALVSKVGAAKIAKSLRVTTATISRWVKSKNPDRLEEIMAGYARGRAGQKAARERAKRGPAEEREFAALVKAAGEVVDLPKVRTSKSERIGRFTAGIQFTKAFRGNLSAGLLDDIEQWASDLPKRYPLFQLVARVSEMALSPKVNLDRPAKKGRGNVYPTVIVQLPHKKAGDFAIDALVTTTAGTRRGVVIGEMQEKLFSMLQSGMVKVFVHSVTLHNYRRRTDEQRRSFESLRRQRRKGRR